MCVFSCAAHIQGAYTEWVCVVKLENTSKHNGVTVRKTCVCVYMLLSIWLCDQCAFP